MGFNFAMTLIDTNRGVLDLRHNAFFHDGPMRVEHFINPSKKYCGIFRINFDLNIGWF